MNDPWEEFARTSEEAPIAGYFERGDAPGTPGRWAISFTDVVDRFEVTPASDPVTLDELTRRHLRNDPRRALVGYVGFDAVSAWEPLLRRRPAGSPFPLGEVAVVENLRRRPVPPSPRANLRGESPPRRALPALYR